MDTTIEHHECYCLLSGREQLLASTHFPEWCDLSALITLSGKSDVEEHYHHYEEIWMWQGGSALACTSGSEVELSRGMLSYTPAQRQHAFRHSGTQEHRLTLIVPRIPTTTRWGHLHLNETQETLEPAQQALLLLPDQTGFDSDYAFPPHAFVSRIRSGRCDPGWSLECEDVAEWRAVLCDDGCVQAQVHGSGIVFTAGQCLCIRRGSRCRLSTTQPSDITIVDGQSLL